MSRRPRVLGGRDRERTLVTLGVLQSFLFAVVCFRKVFAPGYLLHSDFVTPLRYTPTFFDRFVYTWDPVVGGFSYNTPKLTLQLGVAALVRAGASTAFAYKLIVVFVLGLAAATMFTLAFRLARRTTDAWRAYAAASLASALFVTNPWTVNKIHHHFWLVLGIAVLPLIYLGYRRVLAGRGGLPTLLGLSALFVVEATQPHSLFIYVLPVCAITYLVHLAEAPSLARALAATWTTAKLLVLAVLVNAFWLLPIALFYTHTSPTPTGYLMTVENVASMSHHASMVRVTQLRSGLGMKGLVAPGFSTSFRTGIPLIDRLWPVAGIALVVVPLTSLLGARRTCRRERLTFALVAVLALLLLTGTKPPLGHAYRYATLHLPMGWMLRDPFKFGGLFAFAFSVLFALATADLLAWLDAARDGLRPRFRHLSAGSVDLTVRPFRPSDRTPSSGAVASLAAVVLLLVASFHGWPMFTGDLNGHFEPSTVPDDYQQTLTWLAAHDTGGRVLWLPVDQFSVRDPRVYRYNWTEGTARWHVRGSKFLEFSTPGHVMPQNPQNAVLLMWLNERLGSGTTARPSVIFQETGVRYVVVHTDTVARTHSRTVLRRLLADPAISEVYRSGSVHVLRVAGGSLVRAGPALQTDDLDSVAGLYAATANSSENASTVPAAAFTFRSNVSARNGVVSSGDATPLYRGISPTNGTRVARDNWRVVAPFAATNHHRPATMWSKAQVHDPLQGRWHRYLAQRGIESWQTAYGKGIAFTWADRRVPERVTPTPADRLAQWRFVGANVPPGWESLDPEQRLAVRHGHLEITLNRSTYGWKRVVSPAVNATSGNVYRFSFDVQGRHAQGVHAKIGEYDAQGDLVRLQRVDSFGDGNFTRKNVTVDYVPRNASTTALRLQIWDGNATRQPLPNVVQLDNVRVANVTRYARPTALRMNVTLDRPGDYRLVGRYFESHDGGRFDVLIDGHRVPVRTRASFDRFVWNSVATRHLSAGTHTIRLENIYGFNAVNLLELAPSGAIAARRAALDSRLQNESVVYAIDAGHDLRNRHADRVFVGTNDSRQRALSLRTGGRAWRTIDVLKSGSYDVSVRGSGSFLVRLDDHTFPFRNPTQPANATSGNTTIGNTTSGNTTSGNTTIGNTTVGNTTTTNATGGNATIGNTTSGNATTTNGTGGNTTIGNSTSGNATTTNGTGGNASVGNATIRAAAVVDGTATNATTGSANATNATGLVTRRYGSVSLSRGNHTLSVTPVGRTVAAVGFEAPGEWQHANPGFAVSRSAYAANGSASLRVSTYSTNRTWSWTYTDPVNVTPGRPYAVETRMAYRNANQSHVVVEGYDERTGHWTRLGTVPSGQTGTAGWGEYGRLVDVPKHVDRLRFALNAGWVENESAGPAFTWFDDLAVLGVRNNTVASVTLTSASDGRSAGAVVRDDGSTATVTDVTAVSPTTYRVHVNASRPYMLSFGQDYSPLWVAEVHTPSGVKRYKPVPLASAANGFWIDRPGSYTVTVRYRAQRWLTEGVAVSGVTLLACLAVVLVRRRRGRVVPERVRRRIREETRERANALRGRVGVRVREWSRTVRDAATVASERREDR